MVRLDVCVEKTSRPLVVITHGMSRRVTAQTGTAVTGSREPLRDRTSPTLAL
eukprot:CAMPEP_0183361744 /NCGR_PEP_ID=MMETSP0164_2-20130417/63660_1 /TAXON_ID=221442 /ORGANISM="Coccolithus pelagicus ssp braarudi, Strain PLY182g" /LENGTH=51 /DNA_ID=CAMNT_0025536419 /DNA_START=358 /DNA_END=510 /DNA_ORIENTATION=-